jgi:hypothetical protein
LLLDEPALLEIWFNYSNKKVTKSPNIGHAYECYIYLVGGFVNKDKLREEGKAKQDLRESDYLGDLVNVSKQVMLGLFRANKDSQLPIAAVAYYVSKLMVALVVRLHSFEVCCELFENLYLVCNKHSLSDISKTVSALHLYY